ncbi:MAG: hypothetical protein II464_01120 [Oscillospiraceae bacterium]|nr:hypothetical protein [Oscillospiraceae bacterium]
MNENKTKEDRRIAALRIFFLILAAVFIIIGLLNKEYITVLNKAVRICLECIGIG